MNSLISIQILRAIAVFLVVYEHYWQLLPIHNIRNFGLDKFGWDGALGVYLFFGISGFIMFYSWSNRESSAKEFFIRRAIRIVPAYWFFTLLLALLVLIFAKGFAFTNWN